MTSRLTGRFGWRICNCNARFSCPQLKNCPVAMSHTEQRGVKRTLGRCWELRWVLPAGLRPLLCCTVINSSMNPDIAHVWLC